MALSLNEEGFLNSVRERKDGKGGFLPENLIDARTFIAIRRVNVNVQDKVRKEDLVLEDKKKPLC